MKKTLSDHIWNMGIALEEAENAFRNEEVPIGVVITDPDGKIVTKSVNQKEKLFDPCGHAEVLALTEAGKLKKNWRLEGHTLYTTLEPCPMCLGAMVQARIKCLVFGAYDPKGGSISLGYNLYKDKLWSSFTPQIFKTTKLYESVVKTISNGYHIDDDIEAMMMNDFNCSIVRSSPDNIKVTFLEDIEVIKRLL